MDANPVDWVKARGARVAWLLPALGAAIVVLLVTLIAVEVRLPAGLTARLGAELDRDVSGFFPAIWRVLPASPGRAAFQAVTLTIMAALWASYVAALVLLRRARPAAARQRDLVVLAAVTLLAHVLLLFAPPFGSNDVFQYALFGRMINRTNLNPYLTPGYGLGADPIVRYATWPELSSHYGPAFTWLSALAARFAGDGVFATALAFKGLAVIFSLGSCWLIRRLAIELHGGDGAWALAAYAWNPVVLLESAAMGHNDTVMVFCALAGLLLVARGRVWLGFAAMVVSADIKLLTGAVAMLFVVSFVAAGANVRERARRVLGLLAVGVAVLAALWLPFWDRWRGFAMARQLLFERTQVPGASLGPSRLPVAIAFGLAALVAARLVVRVSLARLITVAAGLMMVYLVLFPWRWPWYALSPLALFSVNDRTRADVMLLAVAVLWGGMLMLRYTFVFPPLAGH
jgi:hypothetical protein